MIITKTPLRVSLFGGGTDYPIWFQEEGGVVLSTTINKFCYITCRYLPPFFPHRYRVAYSKIEYACHLDEIQHPSVRECLRYLNIEKGVEIHHDSDLPARSGLGSSSAFTVGLLQALHALKGQFVDKMTLARGAIEVEINRIGENVGWQDQTATAFGGFNVIHFSPPGVISVKPLTISPARLAELNKHLILIFTGTVRTASEIAKSVINNAKNKGTELLKMKGMVQEAISILISGNLIDFGKLLDEYWHYKKSLSHEVSNPQIDDLYETMKSSGAIGGKLLGAGGGGFFLAFVPYEKQSHFLRRLNKLLVVPFHFEKEGCQVVYYRPDDSFKDNGATP